MSTTYYTMPEGKPIGQLHFKGKDKGTHFTWCMFPLAFGSYIRLVGDDEKLIFIDEYGRPLSLVDLADLLSKTTSQSFDERIA